MDISEVNSELDSQSQKRLCWVCFGTEQEDEDKDEIWICPCRCKGTMKWVHEECLQRWIDEKQKRTNSVRVTCSQCKTNYILSFPPVNRFVRLIEQYDKLLFTSSPFVAVSVVMGSIYWCCGSYGYFSIIQVMGYEEGRRLIDEADPLLLIIGLPVIPIALILAKLIKWEDFILQLWRRNAIRLPRPLSYFIEPPPVRPRTNCDQILQDPGFSDPLGCTRMICGALLLPTMATLVGNLLFGQVSGSHWRRPLLGGLTFLLFKGIMKIYLKKSQYIRYSQRTIRSYNPGTKSEGRSRGLDQDSRNQQPSPNDDDDEDDVGILNRVHTDSDDSDEADGQVPRARTLFSMTIRL